MDPGGAQYIAGSTRPCLPLPSSVSIPVRLLHVITYSLVSRPPTADVRAHTCYVPFACQDQILTCNRILTFTCRDEALMYKSNFVTRRERLARGTSGSVLYP